MREIVGYSAEFSDGTSIGFSAGDDRAAGVLDFFAGHTGLQPGKPMHPGYVICVISDPVHKEGENFGMLTMVLEPDQIPRYRLREPKNGEEIEDVLSPEEWLWRQVLRLSGFIGSCLMEKGGFLIHAGLIEYREKGKLGTGILLAGASGAGKTTTTRLLRPPWAPVADDLTLIARGDEGSYRAHPLPTWSRILGKVDPAPRITWDIFHSLPLRSGLFLHRGEEELFAETGKGESLCLLAELINQSNEHFLRAKDLSFAYTFNRAYFMNLVNFVRETRFFTHNLKIDDRFWKEVEKNRHKLVET